MLTRLARSSLTQRRLRFPAAQPTSISDSKADVEARRRFGGRPAFINGALSSQTMTRCFSVVSYFLLFNKADTASGRSSVRDSVGPVVVSLAIFNQIKLI